MHLDSLSFMTDKSARLPKIKPKPPNNIDFPAPVSPVIIENLSVKETSKASINAKFFIDNDCNKSCSLNWPKDT